MDAPDVQQGDAYLIQDSFLASGESDLLPQNTVIFSSTVRLGRPFFFIGIAALAGFLILLIAAAAVPRGGVIVVGIAFATLFSGGLTMAVLARRAMAQYQVQLKNGEWHEGVIVFPSGDVVVRFGGLCGTTDRTIESVYLSRADVVRGWTPWRPCGGRRFLKIHYLGIDARPASVSVCEVDLCDDIARIAQHINDLKSATKDARGF